MSGFVQHAVGAGHRRRRRLGLLLADALAETGGPLTDDERNWADGVLSASGRRIRARLRDGRRHTRRRRTHRADHNNRRIVVLLARVAETDATITVPATALAQAIRHPSGKCA